MPPRRRRHFADVGGKLEDGDVNRILVEMQASFERMPASEGFSMVAATPIRGGVLYRCRPSQQSDGDLALKVKPNWSPTRARLEFDSANHLSATWTDFDGARVVRPLGWAANPPCLCMPYVEGVDLQTLLLTRRDVSHAELVSAVGSGGMALGAFHSRFPAETAGASQKALVDLDRVSRRMLLRRSTARIAPARVLAAACYEDFSPANLRLGAGSAVFLLDPPVRSRIAPIHRDIAVFLSSMRQLYQYSARKSGPPDSGSLLEDLEESFYEGYSQHGPRDVRDATDLWLIRLYEGDRTLVATRNLLAQGRYLWAIRVGARWATSVRRLRRAARRVVTRE